VSEASTSLPIIDAENLDGALALMLDASREWASPDRSERLARALAASRQLWRGVQRALAAGEGNVPLAVRQNLLIVSVYAEGKCNEFQRSPTREKLTALIMMTRNLAASLKEWRQAA
jgi:flagellar biosynthesis regulator FlaF